MIVMSRLPAIFNDFCCGTNNARFLFRSLGLALLHLTVSSGLLVSLLFAAPVHAASALNPTNFADYKIKAVYVHHFANFVHWPKKRSIIRFCALGRDSVTITLENIIKEKSLPGYQASYTSLNNLSEASSQCDIFYLTERKMRMLQRIPQYAEVLTVSTDPNFLNQGGMIELRSVNNQVKPVIEVNNVERGRLTISSQLLRIALRSGVQTGDHNE